MAVSAKEHDRFVQEMMQFFIFHEDTIRRLALLFRGVGAAATADDIDRRLKTITKHIARAEDEGGAYRTVDVAPGPRPVG